VNDRRRAFARRSDPRTVLHRGLNARSRFHKAWMDAGGLRTKPPEPLAGNDAETRHLAIAERTHPASNGQRPGQGVSGIPPRWSWFS